MTRSRFSRTNIRLLSGLGVILAGAVFAYEPPPARFWVPEDPPGAEYVLDAAITVEAGTAALKGSGTITVANTSRRPLAVLAFEWTGDPARNLEIADRGRPLRCLNTEMNLPAATPLFFELPTPLLPGWRTALDVRFSSRAAVRSGQVHLSGWYPHLWWEGSPVRDVFKVKVEAPQGWVMATSGRLNPLSGRYENPWVTTRFGIFLSSSMMSESRESEGVLLTALFTEKGRPCAEACLDTAADIVRFYRGWLGVYPHPSLCIIPGASQPMGGYPYASGIVVIHGQETFDPSKGDKELNWWRWITAHEIGHQYWGEYVMSGDVRGPFTDAWLMIGLGICADKEYMRARGLGWARHRAFIEGYLQGVRAKYDTTLDAPPSLARTQTFDTNNVCIHGKGFAVLSALETLLGRDVFNAIYRRTLNTWAGRRLGWRDFRRLVEETTGQDIGWFFEDWVRSNKCLECRVVSRECRPSGAGLVSLVRVEYGMDSLRMPVPVEADFEDGTSELRWTDRFVRLNVLRFESRSPLKEVRLDPEGRLAIISESIPRSPEEIAEAVNNLDWTGTAEAALEILHRPETAGIKTAHVWFKLGLLLYDGRHYPEAFEAFQTYTRLAGSDGEFFGGFVWMGIIKDLLGERNEALTFYRDALKHDPGLTLQHDQYNLRIDRAWVEARLKTPFKRD